MEAIEDCDRVQAKMIGLCCCMKRRGAYVCTYAQNSELGFPGRLRFPVDIMRWKGSKTYAGFGVLVDRNI
jgi:hypothetical protein